jgi:DNA-binding transcriptional regulator YhcF (GntR family)
VGVGVHPGDVVGEAVGGRQDEGHGEVADPDEALEVGPYAGTQVAHDHSHVVGRYGADVFRCLSFSGGCGTIDPVTLKIHIDDSAPPYEQVRAQISGQARSGVLPVGYRLPTVRGLADTLGLAANTVAKAYRALETDGVIETRGRNGTFVAAAGSAAERELASAAQAYAERARRLGTGEQAALDAVRDALRAVHQG